MHVRVHSRHFNLTTPHLIFPFISGQLCTDLEEIIQEQHPQELIGALVPALEDAEPRVHAHAAAALINFCEGVARDTLVPFLDPIVERLLRLLKNNNGRR